ncbi:hypothetical protein EB73_33970 [Mycobacterium sp. SWH-M3]|nr:hypothetical protein EB73_33970 [Mycobacterium sp. SWH-M3]
MTSGTWLIDTLTTASGIVLLAAVIRTWYGKRGRKNNRRTRGILFGLAFALALAATLVSFTLPPATSSWAAWTFVPGLIAGAAALAALIRDRPRPDSTDG